MGLVGVMMLPPGLLKAADTVQQVGAGVTLPDWSNVASPATILSIISNVVIFGFFLRKQGAKEALNDAAISETQAKVKAVRDDFEAAKTERDRWRETWSDRYQAGREEFRRNVDQTVGGVMGSITILREQQADFKTDVAKTYVTRAELTEVEARNAAAFERVNDRLDLISTQLQDVSTKILAAVERAHAPQGAFR